jgi:hypothetical protein
MRNNSRALMMAALAAGLLGAPAVGGNVEIVRHGSNGSGPTIGPPRGKGKRPPREVITGSKAARQYAKRYESLPHRSARQCRKLGLMA